MMVPNRRIGLITVTVWVHAAVVAAHSAAHVGASVWMPLPATLYIWLVIIIGPVAGWWLVRSGRPAAGSALVCGCMIGALVFGILNHFVWRGIDHVSTIRAGVWRLPFQLTATLLALIEAAGALAGATGLRALARTGRGR